MCGALDHYFEVSSLCHAFCSQWDFFGGRDMKLIPQSLSIRQVVLSKAKQQGGIEGAWVWEGHSLGEAGV